MRLTEVEKIIILNSLLETKRNIEEELTKRAVTPNLRITMCEKVCELAEVEAIIYKINGGIEDR